MNIEKRDVVIIGGGPAGLAAATALHRLGVRDILIVEREKQLGGILRQCIHDGFGLKRFGEALSGPEYAQRFIDEVIENQIPYLTDATVIQITPQKLVTIACSLGFRQVQAKAVVLAMAAGNGRAARWPFRASAQPVCLPPVRRRRTSICTIVWWDMKSSYWAPGILA